MKINYVYILIIAMCFSCGDDSHPQPDAHAVQLGKLSKTWKSTSVKLNDVVQSGYANFQVILSGQAGATSFNYATVERARKSPWNINGTWAFGEPLESVVIRDKGTPDELTMNYVVSDHELTLTFTYAGAGFTAGKESSVKGQWVFAFSN